MMGRAEAFTTFGVMLVAALVLAVVVVPRHHRAAQAAEVGQE